MKNYELIEHTADIRIRVKGRDLRGLFKNSAFALFDILAEKQKTSLNNTKRITVKQKAESLEELFVNWLNELLSLSSVKELVFCGFQIKKLDENYLKAVVKGSAIENYKMKSEIKAATYSGLKIERTKTGWEAEVIFDV